MTLAESVTTYRTPDAAKQLVVEHPPLIICGPTGSGKDTIVRYLMQQGSYAAVVSDTTRAPRPHNDGHEVNGVDYWFRSEAEAIERLGQGAYIEAKLVHGERMYGTSVEAYSRVTGSGRTPILEIDVQGVKEFMDIVPSAEAVFLLPPDFATWQERLDGRGELALEEKLRRLGTAILELDVPLSDTRFFPVINHEVVDTAEVIASGEYRTHEYRAAALALARDIQSATQQFIDAA